MNRARMLVAVAFSASAVLMPLSPASGALDETLTVVSSDVVAYPEVKLVVAAPAQLGDQVLTDSAFWVVEGGVSQPVRVQPLPPDQLEVALVIDTSGSMAGAPLAAAKAAAQSFLNQLPATVPSSVIGFGSSPREVSARSANRAAQSSAIAGLVASGQTALYDALGTALAQVPAASRNTRAVVLLTDGGDTASTKTLDATANAFAAANVPLFAVELRTSDSNPAALSRLTSASGGRVVPASDPTALSGAFGVIAKQLVRQYIVTYRSRAGGATDIDVILDAGGVRAVARRHLQLPGVSPSSPAAARAVILPRLATASTFLGSWVLVLGGALCGLAMLSLLLGALSLRTPRARGLAISERRNGLAGPADRAEALGESLLRRSGLAAAVSGAIDAAGLDVRPGELVAVVIVAALGALAAGWTLVAPFAGLLAALAVPLVAKIGLDLLVARRRKRFSNQLAETLQLLAGSLRAGHGLAQAVDTVAREAESPTADEFRRLTVEARLGRDFVTALASLADRVKTEDFRWVVQAIEIQREVGGDLAEVLDTVASTIRERTRIRRQVSALTAEGRISAWVLMILPVGLAGVMAVTNPEYLGPLFSSGTGHILLAVAAALMAAGGLWLRKIVKPIF